MDTSSVSYRWRAIKGNNILFLNHGCLVKSNRKTTTDVMIPALINNNNVNKQLLDNVEQNTEIQFQW